MNPLHRLSRGITGRSDLVVAKWCDPEMLKHVADSLGFVAVELPKKQIENSSPWIEEAPRFSVEGQRSSQSESDDEAVARYPEQIEPISFWRMTHYSHRQDEPTELESAGLEPSEENYKWRNAPTCPPAIQSITHWPELSSKIRRGFSNQGALNCIDWKKLVRKIARRESVNRLPKTRRQRWGAGVHVILDVSDSMSPFRSDQDELCKKLSRLYPKHSLEIFAGYAPPRFWKVGHENSGPMQLPAPGTRVLVLSDLGAHAGHRGVINRWVNWGRKLKENDCRLLAIVPTGLSNVPSQLAKIFPLAKWDKFAGYLQGQSEWEPTLNRLFVLASPAIRIEPGLLRELRSVLEHGGDICLESEFWLHENLDSRGFDAVALGNEKRREFLKEFERLNDDIKRKVLLAIYRWRYFVRSSPEIWFEEILSLSQATQDLLSPSDIEDAIATVVYFDEQRKVDIEFAGEYEAFLGRTTQRLPDVSYQNRRNGIGRLFRKLKREMHGEIAVGTDPREIPTGPQSHYSVYFSGSSLYFGDPKKLTGIGSGIGTGSGIGSGNGFENGPALNKHEFPVLSDLNHITDIESTNGVVQIRFGDRASEGSAFEPQRESEFWASGRKPAFCSQFGLDDYGLWFDLLAGLPTQVGHSEIPVLRMRWVQPGEFLMGSPETESGRIGKREAQRRVEISRGFWMAETPTTNEIWQFVNSWNTPSQFKGEHRPVESVSYDDVAKFLETINGNLDEEVLGLPSEAQWEYACRAGSTTRFNVGDKLTPADANFDQNVGETTDVGKYPPNSWGFHDFHGNVWEWCQTWFADNYPAQGLLVDPSGPKSGTARVIRGGSWSNLARLARSAFRFRHEPGSRNEFLGFRLLSSVESAEPSVKAKVALQPKSAGDAQVGVAIRIDPNRWTAAAIEANRFAIVTDLHYQQIERVTKPEWATTFGRDSYGVFADFEVPYELQFQNSWFGRKPIDAVQNSRFWNPDTREIEEEAGVVVQRMRFISPGEFQMGSPNSEPGRSEEEIQVSVILSNGFWIFDTPCCQHLWLAVMGGKNPSKFPDLEKPVENVNWDEANQFSRRLTELIGIPFRLPTEAEWEYACRAGTVGPFSFEDNDPIEERGNFRESNTGSTSKIKSYRPNHWGLYDMYGNVWEWCRDGYGEYPSSQQIDPVGPDNSEVRAVRGGSWLSFAQHTRSAYRSGLVPGFRSNYLGFRLLSSIQLPDEPDGGM